MEKVFVTNNMPDGKEIIINGVIPPTVSDKRHGLSTGGMISIVHTRWERFIAWFNLKILKRKTGLSGTFIISDVGPDSFTINSYSEDVSMDDKSRHGMDIRFSDGVDNPMFYVSEPNKLTCAINGSTIFTILEDGNIEFGEGIVPHDASMVFYKYVSDQCKMAGGIGNEKED